MGRKRAFISKKSEKADQQPEMRFGFKGDELTQWQRHGRSLTKRILSSSGGGNNPPEAPRPACWLQTFGPEEIILLRVCLQSINQIE